MRIISGRWKGRHLIAPVSLPVRPTTDMAKEALFNILSNEFDLDSVSVTDLFAGTGNITYEFASRGAVSVRAVDRDRGCVKYIAQTARQLEFSQVIDVVQADVFRYVTRAQQPCDIVFADPPYDLPAEKYRELVQAVMDGGLLSECGIFVLEHPKAIDLSDREDFSQMRRYGTVHFSFFEHPGGEE